MTLAYSKTSVLVSPKVNESLAFLNLSILRTAFENQRFRLSINAVYLLTCRRTAKTEKKNAVFKNIRMRADNPYKNDHILFLVYCYLKTSFNYLKSSSSTKLAISLHKAVVVVFASLSQAKRRTFHETSQTW